MANEQFYTKQLGAAYWYVTHKQSIKRVISLVLLGIIIIFVALNLYLLIFNLSTYGRSYADYLNSLVIMPQQYLTMRQSLLPQPLTIGQIFSVPNGSNTDLVAEISNPNQNWYATFNYQFASGDTTTDLRPGFILPGANKRLVALNISNMSQAGNLVFSDVKWYKEINFTALEADKYKLEVKNAAFVPPTQLGVGEKLPISQLKFDLANTGAYNYADVSLQIYLMSGGQIVAVNLISSGPLYSAQTKSYQVNFFQNLPKITETEIVPEINILDPNSFLKF